MASDLTVTVIGDELPPVFPLEIEPEAGNAGWLYVMRCHLMDDDVYKIGWSSRPPKIRAEEISKATGVPMAYVVVESWKTEEARWSEELSIQRWHPSASTLDGNSSKRRLRKFVGKLSAFLA